MPEEKDRTLILRAKERRVYNDDGLDDDEIDGRRTWCLESKLNDNRFNANNVVERKGTDMTLKYFQENKFTGPIIIRDKTGLGMRMPSSNFCVEDVKKCVGSRRMVDYMDGKTQKGDNMTMKDWVTYYNKKERSRLLNVISLEFSTTRLENYVEQPEVVRQLDWVDIAWPRHLKDSQVEATNIIEKMKYPKVQKYCLMSVAGCYTDFHIDMGGTSVWYHILHGKKIFWLIPPSEANLNKFVEWTLSANQGDRFFGDQMVDCCQRVELTAGYTFFLPSGWIHAVYTPEDSLVFGGNFVHTFNISMQLRIWQIESTTHVPMKFRYPFYTEIHWYMIDRYLFCLTGKSYRVKSEEELKSETDQADENGSLTQSPTITTDDGSESHVSSDWDGPLSPQSPMLEDCSYVRSPNPPQSPHSPRPSLHNNRKGSQSDEESRASFKDLIKPVSVKLENCLLTNKGTKLVTPARAMSPTTSSHSKGAWIHLTSRELQGLGEVVYWLQGLPPTKRFVPKDLRDPDHLLSDVRKMLGDHAKDDAKQAVSGYQVVKWSKRKKKVKTSSHTSYFPKVKGMNRKANKDMRGIRHRRVKCKRCEPCTRDDCRECNHCKDMRKYGGPGRAKQSCVSRVCLAPVLPAAASCLICHLNNLDGKQTEKICGQEGTGRVLMECGICWEILHPACMQKKHGDNFGIDGGNINEDLPNSWECPRCSSDGKQEQSKSKTDKTISPKSNSVRRCSTGSDTSDEGLDRKEDCNFSTASSPDEKAKLQNGRKRSNTPNRRPLADNKVISPRRGKRSRDSSSDRQSPSPIKKGRLSTPTTKGRIASSSDKSSVLNNKKLTTRGRETPMDHGHTEPVTDCGSEADSSVAGDVGRGDEGSSQNSRSNSQEPSGGGGGSGGGRKKAGGSQHSPPLPLKQTQMPTYKYVVRPPPVPPSARYVKMASRERHPLDRDLWLHVFGYLSREDITRCMCVCKVWFRWGLSPQLWHKLDLSRQRITQAHCVGIVKRQPASLNLSWTNISKAQLEWLLPRLPHLHHLHLEGNAWASVAALCSTICPLLSSLNLRWVEGVRDACLRDLLSPPVDHRPGVDVSRTRLHRCGDFALAGTDLSDDSLHVIGSNLPHLSVLDLTYCTRITNEGLSSLATGACRNSLQRLDLTGCKQLTDDAFDILVTLPKLEQLSLQACPYISIEACQQFVLSSPCSLHMTCDKYFELDD